MAEIPELICVTNPYEEKWCEDQIIQYARRRCRSNRHPGASRASTLFRKGGVGATAGRIRSHNNTLWDLFPLWGFRLI